MMGANRGKAPAGGNRPRPWGKSSTTAPATRQGYARQALHADTLDRVRVCAAGIVHHALALDRSGQWRDFDALLRLLDAIRAEAAHLYDGRTGRRGGRT